jgi:hypothetical protein
MPYRMGGLDVHKNRLAVVVADVEVEYEYQFERCSGTAAILRTTSSSGGLGSIAESTKRRIWMWMLPNTLRPCLPRLSIGRLVSQRKLILLVSHSLYCPMVEADPVARVHKELHRLVPI